MQKNSMYQINQQYENWKKQQNKLTFAELEKEILNYDAKSEYKQVAIHIVRMIFEKHIKCKEDQRKGTGHLQ